MTNQVLALREHLIAEEVTCVVMEATSDYWKPFYYLFEDLPGVELMLVNARHVKNLPGRKTDVADATRLAQLGAHKTGGLDTRRAPSSPDATRPTVQEVSTRLLAQALAGYSTGTGAAPLCRLSRVVTLQPVSQ